MIRDDLIDFDTLASNFLPPGRARPAGSTRGLAAALVTAGLLVGLVAGPACSDIEKEPDLVSSPASDPAAGGTSPEFRPGASGAGDPYYPLDGNGGYDVDHYLLDIIYDPSTDFLTGVATITARATYDLSSFNLDLTEMRVESITVNGRDASFSRAGGELIITPSDGVPNGSQFTTVVRYDGVPAPLVDPNTSGAGFIHTDDGALIAGEPQVAETWFPVNDHPSDKASYTFHVTVPEGLQVVANGILSGRVAGDGGTTTWTWEQTEPMASYLATAAIGHFEVRDYVSDGIRYWDAIDPDLFTILAPRTGGRFAMSQQADGSYKRLTRTISVPQEGGQLSFWVVRDTEADWDYAFVEAHSVGADDWTTLPDRNGHTSSDTGKTCPGWLKRHPFLTHYQAEDGDGTCTPRGTSGTWAGATGSSAGYEQWTVDLSGYAGRDVEVSLSYASDGALQRHGVYVDDVVVSTGEGTTSFEEDGDTFDGWTVPGAPAGTAPNRNDWTVGSADQAPPAEGPTVEAVFSRQPEIIDFLSGYFGPYPFAAAGGIVDDSSNWNVVMETQTRPVYANTFFSDPVVATGTVVHELAHQWYGNSVSLARWQHIWLNEGFATYAEWMWSEREGLGTVQENFDALYDLFPPDDPFWGVITDDPGPDDLFAAAVYYRGAMTLQQLRLAVGDEVFFEILRSWAATYAGTSVTTADFIHLAEELSGQDLDPLFETWLFTPGRPVLADPAVHDRMTLSPCPGPVPVPRPVAIWCRGSVGATTGAPGRCATTAASSPISWVTSAPSWK